jgi:hypothetical protein
MLNRRVEVVVDCAPATPVAQTVHSDGKAECDVCGNLNWNTSPGICTLDDGEYPLLAKPLSSLCPHTASRTRIRVATHCSRTCQPLIRGAVRPFYRHTQFAHCSSLLLDANQCLAGTSRSNPEILNSAGFKMCCVPRLTAKTAACS